MKNNRWFQAILTVLACLILNLYVLSHIYNPAYLTEYLLSSLPFIPLIIWISLANPLGKFLASQRRLGYHKPLYAVVIFCLILCAVRINAVEQIMGGFALVPLNLFAVLICLISPIVQNNSREK